MLYSNMLLKFDKHELFNLVLDKFAITDQKACRCGLKTSKNGL